jgi:release factor glutamine methyltransferase
MAAYRELLLDASRRLREARNGSGELLTETPELEAALLLAQAADTDRTGIIVRHREMVPGKAERRFEELLSRRLAGIPVAYLRGMKEFWGLDFLVNEAVLIPRPDTETLVEEALLCARELQESGQALRILDLCCGSGCVGIALASELPETELVLSDISTAALETARFNAARLLGEARKGSIKLVKSDLFADFGKMEPFSVITANPPYLTELEVDRMKQRGLAEPEGALRGGRDGLDLVRTIISRSPGFLAPGGFLLLESDSSQTGAISSIFSQEGYEAIMVKQDLAGRNRVTRGRYRCSI